MTDPTPPPDPDPSSGAGDSGSTAAGGLVETVRTILIAFLIAIAVRTFLYEPFNIPSGSMMPTLLKGDYLFVSKLSYGYSRFSFPFSAGPFDGRILQDEPERGDVAVFRNPNDASIDYIKRIVGLPGDRIQVIGGVLHINGEAVKRRRVEDYVTPEGQVVAQYVETLPNGLEHRILEAKGDAAFLDNTPLFTVPAGHYFGMGDNRDQSQDSRMLSLVGYIPAENLIGRADVLFWSVEDQVVLWKPWTWPTGVRYGRLFDGVD
ncbi:MAG: signal peptidase I [Alphaproteobacteria bacterium]|nr:signal peptidase I [Alphaproteobacteria bacterium]